MANLTISDAIGILGEEITKAKAGSPGANAKLISGLSSNFFKGVITHISYEKYKKDGGSPVETVERSAPKKK